MKIAAIVPMRHSSERVPGKNYRDFAGKPLYHRVVEALLACDKISQVVIDSPVDWRIHRQGCQDVGLEERVILFIELVSRE